MEEFEVKIPTVSQNKKKIYSENELAKLLKKPNLKQCLIGEYKTWVSINFLLGTGCRAETFLNVLVKDVDLRDDNILSPYESKKTNHDTFIADSQIRVN